MSLKTTSKPEVTDKSLKEIVASQFKIYSYAEVEAMTNDFQHVLGEGGFSKVYKGNMGNVQVAVKVFKEYDEETFMREIKNMTYISHPNVIVVRGICHEGQLCIVMDFLEKGSLQDVIDDIPGCVKMDRIRTLEILIELCKAMEDFHDKNFYHLDIKPSNILFDKSGNPKFSDFNGSYYFASGSSSHTFTHGGFTLGYMDPFSMTDGFGFYTDIYAFGITILALLTKRKNIYTLCLDAKQIFERDNLDDLKKFFTKEWCDENGMNIISCVMDCLKIRKKERINAKKLAMELGEIKNDIEYGNIDDDFATISIEDDSSLFNIPEVPHFMIQTKKDHTSNMLVDSLSDMIKNSPSSKISIEEINELKFDPIDHASAKNVFICYNVEKINYILPSLIKLSKTIAFHNINTIEPVENIEMDTSIILQCNKPVNLRIKDENYIKLSGKIHVSLINFHIKDCDRTNRLQPLIQLANRSRLHMKNVLFQNNTSKLQLIAVGVSSRLNLQDCKFDANKMSAEREPLCILAQKDSYLSFHNVHFINHSNSSFPFKEGSNSLVMTNDGNVSIEDCLFENNLPDLTLRQLNFKGYSKVNILKTTFRKCTKMLMRDNSVVNMKNCTFDNNGNKDKFGGGAIIILGSACLNAKRCFFNNNTAVTGGSLCCFQNSQINMQECTFDNNKVDHEDIGIGGALRLKDDADGEFEGCRFLNNYAVLEGGALSLSDNSSAEVKNCYFEKNISSKNRGHSIYAERLSQFKLLSGNIYVDSKEEDKSNVCIDVEDV